MKLRSLLLAFILILLLVNPSCAYQSDSPAGIIPEPVETTPGNGHFELDSETPIYISEDSESLQFLGEYIANMIYSATWYKQSVQVNGSPNAGIFLHLDAALDIENDEGYVLNISPEKVEISAASEAGLFYGVQSLRQLLPESIEYELPSMTPRDQQWQIPSVTITDYPRFEYRGMHLDVARHFSLLNSSKSILICWQCTNSIAFTGT